MRHGVVFFPKILRNKQLIRVIKNLLDEALHLTSRGSILWIIAENLRMLIDKFDGIEVDQVLRVEKVSIDLCMRWKVSIHDLPFVFYKQMVVKETTSKLRVGLQDLKVKKDNKYINNTNF